MPSASTPDIVLQRAFRRLATGLALLAASLPVAGQSLPVDYFTRDDTVGTLKISPEGDFLAATMTRSGTSMLAFFELDGMVVTGATRTSGADEITRFDWVSNSRVVYAYAERYPGRDYAVDTGEIFAIDRDGGGGELLYGYRASDARIGSRLGTRESTNAFGELLSVLRDNDDKILILERPYRATLSELRFNADAHPRIAMLDVHNGRKTVIDRVPLALADVVVDRRDQARFAVGYDESSVLTALWKPVPDAEWKKFEIPGFRAGSVIPRRFTPDERAVLFTAVADGESVEALYKVDLASASVECLFQHAEADIADTVTDLAGNTIIGVEVVADKPEYHWIAGDDTAVQVYKKLERAFKGQSIAITSVDANGSRAIVFVYSDVNPGDYYLFDLETNNARHLQAARTWIDPGLMRHKEPISLQARDGLQLHGYLTRPRDGAGPFPLVVLPHGGPHGLRDGWGFDWEVQLLANRGYAVLQVNFRGSSGYGLAFQAAGYEEWGARMQDDLTDATQWAISEGITDANSICIFGSSYGGYASMMGLVREPGLYQCGIAYAGVYDLELMFEAGDTQRWRVGQAFLDRFLGNDAKLLRERSPAHNAERIEAPVLLIHGKDDGRADYEHATRMKKALERAGKDFEWMALSREGHGVFNEETRKEVYERILGFLDQHLPPAAGPATKPAG